MPPVWLEFAHKRRAHADSRPDLANGEDGSPLASPMADAWRSREPQRTGAIADSVCVPLEEVHAEDGDAALLGGEPQRLVVAACATKSDTTAEPEAAGAKGVVPHLKEYATAATAARTAYEPRNAIPPVRRLRATS